MSENHRPDWKMQAALGAAIAVALWPLRAIRYHPDGLDYALTVREGAGLWHPHHLLYSPIAHLIHRITPLDAIAACQLEQILLTVVLFLAAWRLAARLLDSTAAGLAAAALLLGARGTLLYATWLEVYIPALAAALLVASEMAAPSPSRARTAAYLTLAVLLHQLGVFAAAGVLVAAPRRRDALVGVTTAGAAVLAVYLAAGGGDPGFMVRYALSGVPQWGDVAHLGPEGAALLGAGLWRVIIPLPATAVGTVGPVAAAVTAIGLVLLLAGSFRRDRVTAGAAVWLAFHLCFVFWWLPGEVDLYVGALAPLWLLGVIGWRRWRRSRRVRIPVPAVAAAALILLAVNLVTSVLPNRVDRGDAYREAERLDRAVPAGYALITDFETQQNLRYFFDRADTRQQSDVLRGATPWPDTGLGVAVAIAPPDGDPAAAARWQAGLEQLAAGRAAADTLAGYLVLAPAGARP